MWSRSAREAWGSQCRARSSHGPQVLTRSKKMQENMFYIAQDARAACPNASDHTRGRETWFFSQGGGACQPAHISPHPLDLYVRAVAPQRERPTHALVDFERPGSSDPFTGRSRCFRSPTPKLDGACWVVKQKECG